MRLIRFGEKGKERPAILKEGRIVDLRKHFPDIPDIGPSFFRDGWLTRIGRVTDEGMQADLRLGSPVTRPSKIICLGKNYAEHAREGGFEKPEKPNKIPAHLPGNQTEFHPNPLVTVQYLSDWIVFRIYCLNSL